MRAFSREKPAEKSEDMNIDSEYRMEYNSAVMREESAGEAIEEKR